MKNNVIIRVLLFVFIVMSGASCDTENLRNLDNPKHMLTKENADMSWMFTDIIRTYGRGYIGGRPVQRDGVFLKYYSTHSNLAWAGSINQWDAGINDDPWGVYSSSVVEVVTLEDYLLNLNEPKQAVNLAFTQIMKAAIFQRLTDFYGDIPYTEAGRLAISNFELNKPKYDPQSLIYDDLLKTVKAAVTVLASPPADAEGLRWKTDFSYNGDMNKWKKFANSLMLRMAMRISDVEPGKAKEYAELAIANGVITANADNYIMKTGTNTNPDERNDYSRWFEGTGGGDPERYVKLGEYFVDWLKDKNDPRMKIIFGGRLNNTITQVAAAQMGTYWRVASNWNWDLTQAKGVPHGISAIPTPNGDLPLYHHTYTSPNPFLFTFTRPIELVTASEMLLLISEAASKGWNTGSYTAQSAYEAGVKANMSQLTGYSGLLDHQTISAQEMTDYLAANPLGTADVAKKRLAEEMWITMYLNPAEGWFNARRMDLNLPPNSSVGPMPVRNAYPADERSNNIDNLNATLERLGWGTQIGREQEMQKRVWWDVK